MPRNSIRRLVTVILAVVLMAGFLLVDSSAQKRRRRKRTASAPLITNPAIYQPSPSDNTNTNSDGDTSNSSPADSRTVQPARTTAEQDAEAMKKTMRTLSTKVDQLTDKLTQMEEFQRSVLDLERVSRAEARSAALRAELREVQTKEADLEAKAEDVEYALKPENIERVTNGYGTAHPEEARDQRRRQLESEKQRIRKQLDQLAVSHARLDEAIGTSDLEIERLHKKLDTADETAIENAKTKARSEGPALSAPSPTPTPTPYQR